MPNIDGLRLPGLTPGADTPQRPARPLETAARLAAGASVRAAGAATGDKVELTAPAPGAEPRQEFAGALDEIDSLLSAIRSRVEFIRDNPSLPLVDRLEAQNEIDAALDQIDRVALNGRLDRRPFFGGFASVATSGVSEAARGVSVFDVELGPGRTLDIDVNITQSAQAGSLLLNFGRPSLDLGAAGDRFVIEVLGTAGSRELSFASGTTVEAVLDAINTFTSVTGVIASATSTGVIALLSVRHDSSGFVRVKVLDDGGISSSPPVGLYQARQQDFRAQDPASRTDFGHPNAANGITDIGQDLAGTINGVSAVLAGEFELLIDAPELAASVRLHPRFDGVGAYKLGSFRAATLTGDAMVGRGDRPGDVLSPVGSAVGPVATAALGRVGPVDGASVEASIAGLRFGQGFNVVNGDLDGALLSLDRARFELDILEAQIIDGAVREADSAPPIGDPAQAAADVRRTLFARSWQTVLSAIGGAPRADRFG